MRNHFAPRFCSLIAKPISTAPRSPIDRPTPRLILSDFESPSDRVEVVGVLARVGDPLLPLAGVIVDDIELVADGWLEEAVHDRISFYA